ncbi:MAG: glycosyltransferase family 2 protein [Lactobacillaceae bacterium]
MVDNKFKIFAFMTVKNEADIVIETLLDAVKWADKIVIMDNMSNDDTWDKLIDFADKNEKIILWGRYGGKFHLSLRQVIFNDYRYLSSEGDWWCRLDGDEFYIDDPRDFLANLDDDIDCVYNASFQYYYTEDDFYREHNSLEKQECVINRLVNYKCNHSEIRFIKDKADLCWPQYSEWPINIVNPSSKRIRLKHYQYRSLQQISERLKARKSKESGASFMHEKVTAEEWYTRRGFSIPDSEEFQSYRVVLKKDLESNHDYHFLDKNLPAMRKYSLIGKIKRKLIAKLVNYVMKK